MRVNNIASLIALCAVFAAPALAVDEAVPPTLNYQTGDVVLPNKVATLHLGGRYRYLDPAETDKLLVAWGNPRGYESQGAIVPADVDPFSADRWAVVLKYVDEGHVDDSDAKDMDYADLMKGMQKEAIDADEARKQGGFEAVRIVGWAEQPHYDLSAKKLYWAKELSFAGDPTHTLNYDVRVLGREGVLSMNAVAAMSQLPKIREDMKPLIEVAEFNSGYRYAEYNKKTDRLAEYGLGALIAGGVAAKLGLFAKLGAILLAAKKFIIMGIVALGGVLSRLFGKKKKDAAA